MTEPVVAVAASPEQTQAIARFVSNLLDGKGIDCGDGTRLLVSLPFDFTVVAKDRNTVRLTITKRTEVDRDGPNVWLEYLDAHRDGTLDARLNKLGLSFTHRLP